MGLGQQDVMDMTGFVLEGGMKLTSATRWDGGGKLTKKGKLV